MEIGWKDTSLVRASPVACLCSTSSCVDVPFTNCLEVQESVYKYIACLHGSWGWGNYEASFPLFTLLAAAHTIIPLCNTSGPKEKVDQWFSNFLATPDSKKYILHCDSVLHIYVYLPIWLKKFYKIRTLSNIIHYYFQSFRILYYRIVSGGSQINGFQKYFASICSKKYILPCNRMYTYVYVST